MKNFLLLICFSSSCFIAAAQQRYYTDASKGIPAIIEGHLKFGTNYNQKGDTISANSLYFIKNNKPWFPAMGEFHFSRFPKQLWEESILKMKAAGIDVIATYVFWIHHEETEGNWNWENNNDLNYFASLCKKHNVFLFLRIGPWCHGEVRNGGFPDWLLQKTKTRRNDSAYLHYVSVLYKQIHEQVKDFYFKNNGTIIGTQIENEFRFNNAAGLTHMLTLKKLAVDAGIDLPYYTATGWPGSNLKQKELIPVWGSYPEAPWDKRTTELPLSDNYRFDSLRNDNSIGNDLITYAASDTANFKGYLYPYATAEMGGGNQITYHRRPVITAGDVTALAYVKTGAGANLMGYYMFHGGTNPLGKLSTMQESKATKYPNDYAIINYDFQSPLGQWGQVQSSYRPYKLFHLFLNDFGERLAATTAFFPDEKQKSNADSSTLRWAVRSNGNSGFVFISNYQRKVNMQTINNVQFRIRLKSNELIFPAKEISVPQNTQAVFPFNLSIKNVLLRYATVQPLCILQNNIPTYVFFAHDGIKAEYVFNTAEIKTIRPLSNSVAIKKGTDIIAAILQPGINCMFEIENANGEKINMITLSHEEALDSWKTKLNGQDYLVITSAECRVNDNKIILANYNENNFSFTVYPVLKGLISSSREKLSYAAKGNAAYYSTILPAVKWKADLTAVNGESLPAANLPDSIISMPLYGTKPTKIPGAKYWKMGYPASFPTHVKDVMIEIDYSGDTQAAYLDSTLVADDFYYGIPAAISVRQLSAQPKKKELLLLITPYTGKMPVYFSEQVRNKVKTYIEPAINSVKISPYYQVELRLKK